MRAAIINITGSGISGGYKKYLQNILPLISDDPRVSAVLCASPQAFRIGEWVAPHPKLQMTVCSPFRFLRHSPDEKLAAALYDFGPDVLFIPISRYMDFHGIPTVTMIQNMAPLVPGAWSGLMECAGLAAQWMETRLAVRKADKVIAMSDFVRRFLFEKWSVPEDKVRLIYFGNSIPAAHPARPPSLPPDWREFLFTAGSIEKYRGLEDVIRCAHHARSVLGKPLKIVIGGSARKAMLAYRGSLLRMSEELGVAGDLFWAGQLSDAEMSWCYRNCSVFIMSSKVESFAVIVLEALAHGCQCVAVDNPPLPEAFGDSAEYYRSGRYESLAEKVFLVLGRSKEELARRREKVLMRSSDFSWATTARLTVDILLEAVQARRGATSANTADI